MLPQEPATAPAADSGTSLRHAVYAVMIAAAAGIMLGRILAVDSIDYYRLEAERRKQIEPELARRTAEMRAAGRSDEEIAQKIAQVREDLEQKSQLCRPFLSGNDRSRWCTLRALVEPDMRVPGAPYAIDRVIQQPNWDTIDMVKHDRRYEPPEGPLPQLKPGDRIRDWDGRQVGGHLYSSKPPLYPTLLAGVYWAVHKATGETLGTQPYLIGRTILIISQWLPMLVYFVLLTRLIDSFGSSDWGRVFAAGAGIFGTFLTTFSTVLNNHLPAAVCVLISLYAWVQIERAGRRHWGWFATAGLFAALAVANELPAAAWAAAVMAALIYRAWKPTLCAFVPAAVIVAIAFFATNWIAHRTIVPPYAQRTTEGGWYNYTYIRQGRVIESYWLNPVGVDQGEPHWPTYALHVLVGHHGIFSLQPIWLLAAVGLGLWLVRSSPGDQRLVAAAIVVVSLVCIAFYLAQPVPNRNYGGMTCGLRWLFWFSPLWTLAIVPAADACAPRRWLRGLAYLTLTVSVLSVSYPTWNPWTHPWLTNAMAYWGLL